MPPLNVEVHSRIRAVVQAILEQNSIVAAHEPDTRLVELGLTSMDMVDLMLRVEAEFDFTIPHSDITSENFGSVATLQAMVIRHLAAAMTA